MMPKPIRLIPTIWWIELATRDNAGTKCHLQKCKQHKDRQYHPRTRVRTLVSRGCPLTATGWSGWKVSLGLGFAPAGRMAGRADWVAQACGKCWHEYLRGGGLDIRVRYAAEHNCSAAASFRSRSAPLARCRRSRSRAVHCTGGQRPSSTLLNSGASEAAHVCRTDWPGFGPRELRFKPSRPYIERGSTWENGFIESFNAPPISLSLRPLV
jgi:hypothetical protein